MNTDSFNLVTDPWIPVYASRNNTETVGLDTFFTRPADYATLDIADPLERTAVTRLLLSIMYTARPGGVPEQEARTALDGDATMLADIRDYLTDHINLFDIKHPEHPFLQTAGMRPSGDGTVSNLSRLHPGMQRELWRTGDPNRPIPPDTAARMLLTCHAYDVSGIHTGMIGDPLAKQGKRMAQGVGQAGGMTLALVEGRNMWETLLLNFAPHEGGDKPVWEYGPLTLHPLKPTVTGCAFHYAYPTRRIRLLWDERGDCKGAYNTFGDRSDWTHPEYEPMAFWGKDDANPAKKLRDNPKPVNFTFGDLIDRPLWSRWAKGFMEWAEDGAPVRHYPKTFDWAARLISGGHLYITTVRVQYGSQSSTVANVREDRMVLDHARLVSPETPALAEKLVREAWPHVKSGMNAVEAWRDADRRMEAWLAGD